MSFHDQADRNYSPEAADKPQYSPAPKEEELKPWTCDYDGTDYCLVENGVTFALVEDQVMAYKILDKHNATLPRRASIPEQEKERIAQEAIMALRFHPDLARQVKFCDPGNKNAILCAINEALNWKAD